MYLAAVFAAFRSVEEDPYGEIVGEIFEAMFDAGTDKEKIVWAELLSLAFADKFPGAGDHYVNFILLVRRLRIGPARRVKFYLERAMLEQRDGSFLLRFREAGVCLIDADCPRWRRSTHAADECKAMRLPSESTITARKPCGPICCFFCRTFPPFPRTAPTASSSRPSTER